ncbi:metal-dependent phosphohydrolase, partial [Streptomyces sp. SID14478]|nr:metal-dependent phosphohydrolase [Streptomyces sp. SID14478]
MYAVAGALTTAALGSTLWYGLDDRGVALAFGLLVAVGELARWGGGGDREA